MLRDTVSVVFVLSLVENQMERIMPVTNAQLVPVHPCRLFSEQRWLGGERYLIKADDR